MKVKVFAAFLAAVSLQLSVLIAPEIYADDNDHGSLIFADSSHDFGQVARGEKLKARFSFSNAGKGPLTIQGVHAACGCTAVEVDRGRKYQPGEAGVVEITLDTTDFEGDLQKAVIVMSSERLTPDRTLTLKAFVKSEIEAQPPLVDFGAVVAKDGATKSVRILPVNGFKLALKDLVYNPDVLTVTSVAEKDPKDGWTVTVRLKPNLAPGFLKEQIIVKNNSVHLGEMPIPVRANIKGDIEFAPQYLEFGAIAAQERTSRSLTLSSANAIEIKRSRAELSVNGRRIEGGDKYVKFNMPAPDKDKQLVSIELQNPTGLTGSVHGKLIFETAGTSQTELTVDFYAFFR